MNDSFVRPAGYKACKILKISLEMQLETLKAIDDLSVLPERQ
jgi:hypothetical protein